MNFLLNLFFPKTAKCATCNLTKLKRTMYHDTLYGYFCTESEYDVYAYKHQWTGF